MAAADAMIALRAADGSAPLDGHHPDVDRAQATTSSRPAAPRACSTTGRTSRRSASARLGFSAASAALAGEQPLHEGYHEVQNVGASDERGSPGGSN